jgi:hypothetical protein
MTRNTLRGVTLILLFSLSTPPNSTRSSW